MTDLRDLVRLHGGDLFAGGRAARIPGPGHSRRDRSLSLTLGHGGRVVFYSHAGDDCRSVMAYLGLEPGAARRESRAEGLALSRARLAAIRAEQDRDAAFCARVWDATRPIAGTAAERYLASRGLEAAGCEVLRFHAAAPRCKHARPEAPAPQAAMVALVSDAAGRPRALHLTYLSPDGRKAFGPGSRRMFGATAGCAVRLCRAAPGRPLAVAEGIETALAYRALTGMAVWACLSTAGLRSFRPPAGIAELVIAADHDASGAGLKAARVLAERAARGRIEMPARQGWDWADVVAEAAR